jgi:hypothetical protein
VQISLFCRSFYKILCLIAKGCNHNVGCFLFKHVYDRFCVGNNCEGSLVATPLWVKCEGEAHTPKSGKLESSETSKNSELDYRGQISLYSSVLDFIGKVLKCRCPKWPRMCHLDIYSPSYGQKKGRESNCQFDSRPLKVGNRPLPDVR